VYMRATLYNLGKRSGTLMFLKIFDPDYCNEHIWKDR